MAYTDEEILGMTDIGIERAIEKIAPEIKKREKELTLLEDYKVCVESLLQAKLDAIEEDIFRLQEELGDLRTSEDNLEGILWERQRERHIAQERQALQAF